MHRRLLPLLFAIAVTGGVLAVLLSSGGGGSTQQRTTAATPTDTSSTPSTATRASTASTSQTTTGVTHTLTTTSSQATPPASRTTATSSSTRTTSSPGRPTVSAGSVSRCKREVESLAAILTPDERANIASNCIYFGSGDPAVQAAANRRICITVIKDSGLPPAAAAGQLPRCERFFAKAQ